jgi:3-deoxy-D-manno-octulosonic-acid transferase
MFNLLYNFFLLLFALAMLPKLLWQSKYRRSLKERLGLALPTFTSTRGQEVIWLHAVSMGETRAIIPLYRKIRKAFPESAVVISTTTETGQAEAKRSMPDANAHFLLPLDFSWTIRRFMTCLKPARLILCESDFWYNLLTIAHKRGVRIDLVNGKVSERSCRRFRKIPFFTRRLFANFDHLCVQSQRYRDRFLSMGISKEKIFVTGNLKFDSPTKKMDPAEREAFLQTLGITPADRILIIGSTHAPEEELILSALSQVWKQIPNLKAILVPRHPERFDEVAALIQQKKIDYRRFSQPKSTNERLILVDAMGKLNQCYQIADIALVAGSFTSHVGGHNIIEPIVFDVPVLFGPYMHSQPDLEELVLTAKAGRQITIEQLPETLLELLENPKQHLAYVHACHSLAESIQGATDRTFSHLF